MSRGLSALQCAILRHVLREHEHVEANGNAFWRDDVSYWGVDWQPFGDDTPSASERAAMSRALRRLEARGLVQRRNQRTGDRYQDHCNHDRPPVTRTTSVKLTDEGRRLAQRLTKYVTPIVNRYAADVGLEASA